MPAGNRSRETGVPGAASAPEPRRGPKPTLPPSPGWTRPKGLRTRATRRGLEASRSGSVREQSAGHRWKAGAAASPYTLGRAEAAAGGSVSTRQAGRELDAAPTLLLVFPVRI